MEVLEARIASFNKSSKRTKNPSNKASGSTRKWPHPSSYKATPRTLAEAGFYYEPSSEYRDNVTCFLCGKHLADWDEDDDPFALHWEKCGTKCAWAAVRCGLIEDMDEDGKFVFPNPTRLPSSKAMEKARLETFTADKWWPHDSIRGHGANSKKMAKAGFVYAPESVGDDTAVCLYCGISLGGWDEGDDPLEEHRKREQKSGKRCPLLTASESSAPTILTRSTSKPPSKSSSKPPSRTVSNTKKPKAPPSIQEEPEGSEELEDDIVEMPPPRTSRSTKRSTASSSNTKTSSRASSVPAKTPSSRRGTTPGMGKIPSSRETAGSDIDTEASGSEIAAGKKVSKAKSKKVAASSSKNRIDVIEEENEEEAEFEDAPDPEPEVVVEKPKRGRPKKNTSTAATKVKKTPVIKEDDDDFDDQEPAPAPPKPKPSRARTRSKANLMTDSESEVPAPGSRSRTKPPSRSKSKKDIISEDEAPALTQALRSSTSQRLGKGKVKLIFEEEELEDVPEEDLDNLYPPAPKGKAPKFAPAGKKVSKSKSKPFQLADSELDAGDGMDVDDAPLPSEPEPENPPPPSRSKSKGKEKEPAEAKLPSSTSREKGKHKEKGATDVDLIASLPKPTLEGTLPLPNSKRKEIATPKLLSASIVNSRDGDNCKAQEEDAASQTAKARKSSSTSDDAGYATAELPMEVDEEHEVKMKHPSRPLPSLSGPPLKAKSKGVKPPENDERMVDANMAPPRSKSKPHGTREDDGSTSDSRQDETSSLTSSAKGSTPPENTRPRISRQPSARPSSRLGSRDPEMPVVTISSDEELDDQLAKMKKLAKPHRSRIESGSSQRSYSKPPTLGSSATSATSRLQNTSPPEPQQSKSRAEPDIPTHSPTLPPGSSSSQSTRTQAESTKDVKKNKGRMKVEVVIPVSASSGRHKAPIESQDVVMRDAVDPNETEGSAKGEAQDTPAVLDGQLSNEDNATTPPPSTPSVSPIAENPSTPPRQIMATFDAGLTRQPDAHVQTSHGDMGESPFTPFLASMPITKLTSLSEEESNMTIEQWIRRETEVQYHQMKTDGERAIAEFLEKAARTRKIIEDLST